MRFSQAQRQKIVIAHRGASGYLPEHTLTSKVMAYQMGADYIEQDLVLTKDDVPVVIHDIYLDDVTNVAELFPHRARADGRFYVMDFTYEDIKTLEVTERFNTSTKKAVYPNRFPINRGRFGLHSLQEEIELIQGLNKSTGKNIGIYPEIKNPEFHLKHGKDISRIVLNILASYNYLNKDDLCVLQCFDIKELKRIRFDLNSMLNLTQLTEIPLSQTDIRNVASYADAIGPSIALIYTKTKKGTINYSNLVKIAHGLNLKVHAYTFRADALGYFKSFEAMLQQGFLEAHLDGIFTDFPDQVIQFLNDRNL